MFLHFVFIEYGNENSIPDLFSYALGALFLYHCSLASLLHLSEPSILPPSATTKRKTNLSPSQCRTTNHGVRLGRLLAGVGRVQLSTNYNQVLRHQPQTTIKPPNHCSATPALAMPPREPSQKATHWIGQLLPSLRSFGKLVNIFRVREGGWKTP